ncbi:hypothetical protein ACP4OV_028938 [Aristida adscensionis]
MASASAPACAASELVAKGRESAAVLQDLLVGGGLGQQPAVGASATPRNLVEQIIRCCDRALAALQAGAAAGGGGGGRKRKPERGGPVAAASSKRMRGSGGEKGTRIEKKSTMEDGFIWRKYGHKDIHGSKYPRLYFRCTYKDGHGCMARRQVQQSDADPSVYLITYFGDHTCCRRDDGDDEPPPAPFVVINFGSGTRDDAGQPAGGSPWPSSCDDDGVVAAVAAVASEASAACGLPEGEEQRAGTGNVAQLMEQPAPAPEATGLSSPGSEEYFGGCLDWELGESLFNDDIDELAEFINFDYYLVGLAQ